MEEDKIARIRELMPATRRVAYLNTGTAGPLPTPVVEEMRAWVERELTQGRIGEDAHKAADEVRARCRRAVASVIGAAEDEVALTHFTTEGLNIVLWGIDWHPGDELVTTNLEHPAIFLPANAVRDRFGVSLKVVDLGLGDGDIVGTLSRALTSRTRLIALSHVSFSTGAVLPVREIVEVAHARGIPVLVDGAQSAGALPLDMPALQADFYSIPGQKWFCGPEDTGALFVRRDSVDKVRQTFVGYASMAKGPEGSPPAPHAGARRFEVGARHSPSIAGQASSIEWMRDQVGLPWAHERIRQIAASVREQLAAIAGVKILTPSNAAGLLCYSVAGADVEAMTKRLVAQGVVVRSVREPSCIRASLGFFNTEQDVERLAEATAKEAARS
ncbi:MAG: aminotransferase class V-fold PLP-dependent enzyme [Dehalococcoidales bacterium]|nr:aminotransferase class V-fold PLP-dependent enzyme [Dehalococcoidales bacterium]